MSGIEPTATPLDGLIGFPYYDSYYFFTETDNSDYSFAGGWSNFIFTIGDSIVCTETSGPLMTLEVDYEDGIVTPTVDRSVTAGITRGTQTYKLTALDQNNKLQCLMLGVFTWKDAK